MYTPTHTMCVCVCIWVCVCLYVCMKEICSALNLPLHPCRSPSSTQVRPPSVHWVRLSLSSIVSCSFLLSLPPCSLLIQMLILKNQLSTTSSIPLRFCFVSDSGPLFWYHFVLEVHCMHSFPSLRAGALLIQPAWCPPLPWAPCSLHNGFSTVDEVGSATWAFSMVPASSRNLPWLT